VAITLPALIVDSGHGRCRRVRTLADAELETFSSLAIMEQRPIHLLRSLLPLPVHLLARFIKKGHSYFPNVIFPTTFNEKILAKMLFDRSPLLVTAADKLAARTFIASRIGDEYLPKVRAVWSAPGAIELGADWGPVAIKANHGSGYVKLIPDAGAANTETIRKLAATWFAINYGRTYGEWCYRDIEPRVFAEEMIGDGNADDLVDYKIFCFSGQPRFLKIIKGMKGATRSYYADLKCRDMYISDGQPSLEADLQRPPTNFDLMLSLARSVSAGFDMLRVDMYNVNGRIYVGELTNYPQAGIIPFRPAQADAELGRYWDRATMKYLPFSSRTTH
jgi:hypothetical protein